MPILPDHKIAALAEDPRTRMIEPFERRLVRHVEDPLAGIPQARPFPPLQAGGGALDLLERPVAGHRRIVSYGLSSYGYDARVANTFNVFTNTHATVVDPKAFDPQSVVEVDANAIRRKGRGGPGLWFRPDVMRVSAWMAHYHVFMLNQDGAFLPWSILKARRSAATLGRMHGSKLFVRPDGGMKVFPGQVVDWECSRQALLQIEQMERLYHIDPEMLVFYAPAQPLPDVEWRFWIVNRQVVAWSPYGHDRETPLPWKKAPPAAIKLAEALAAHPWQPDIAWVADIVAFDDRPGGKSDGAALIEVNAASTAGVYAAPLAPLLTALAAAMEGELAGDIILGDV